MAKYAAMSIRRLIAAVALLVVAVTQIAPHHHPEVTSKGPMLQCGGPTSGVAHLHPNPTPQRENCLACFRQHLQATISKVTLGTPQTLAQFVIVTLRIAHARTVRLRQSSRAPPSLPS
jgi:hypothetical protein